MLIGQAAYATAEVEYRTTRARNLFTHHEADLGSHEERRRFHVRRLPSLHLPRPRRRPLSLA